MQKKIKLTMTVEYVILIIVMVNIGPSNEFSCGQSKYSCGDGTQCRPKADRCQHGSECDLPLPIERPPCPEECQVKHESWCEKRGQCVSKVEVCDCGPGKIYCVGENEYGEEEYSCENRLGIAKSSLYKVCRDGTCSGKCTENARDSCREGQFKCGSACINITQITQNRSCSGECIAAKDFCYLVATTPSYTDEPSSSSTSSIIAGIVLVLLLSLLVGVVLYKWEAVKTRYRSLKINFHNTGPMTGVPYGDVEQAGGVDEPASGEEHIQLIEETSSSQESLESRLRRLQEDHVWLIVEEEHPEKGCYCSICLQAGVDNGFTKYPGVAPTDENIQNHLQAACENVATFLCIEVSIDQMEPNQINQTHQNTHKDAVEIMSEVELLTKDVIESRPTFSLILYEQNNILTLILKALKIIDETESQGEVQDVYIPLHMMEIKEDTHDLSIVEEIRKNLADWQIKMDQISSISAVNIGGRLPSKSVSVCDMFCKLPGSECICLHNILHEPTIDVPQQHIQQVFLNHLQTLTDFLSKSPYESFGHDKLKHGEPILHITDSITENIFLEATKKPLKDVIHFVQAYPKSIGAILADRRKEIVDSNESDENKLRVSEVVQFMDEFSGRAAMLLYQHVVDVFRDIFKYYEYPNTDWDAKEYQSKIKYLESISKGNLPTLFIQNDDTSQYLAELLKEFQLEENISEKEKNSFVKYQQKYIISAIKDLQSSFPKETIDILQAMSKILTVNKISLSPEKKQTNEGSWFGWLYAAVGAPIGENAVNTNEYHAPMDIISGKFSKLKERKENLKKMDDIQVENKDFDLRKFAKNLVIKYSKIIPHFAHMAEIYLNINMNTKKLRDLLLAIDEVIRINDPKLKLQEKNKKVTVKTVRKMMQHLEDNENKDDPGIDALCQHLQNKVTLSEKGEKEKNVAQYEGPKYARYRCTNKSNSDSE